MTAISGQRQARLYIERQFAHAALRQFGLAEAPIRLLRYSAPMLFAVDGETRAVLRLHPPDRHPFAVVHSELVWLQILSTYPDLLAPQPIPTRDGRLLIEMANPEHTDSRYASLLRWIPGHHQVHRLGKQTVQELGRVLAHLHDAAVQFQPPPGFLRWDGLDDDFDWSGASIAAADPRLLLDDERHITEQALQVIDRTIRHFERHRTTYGLIHGDTNLSNFIHHRGQIAIIDFEVCCYGAYLFDVTRTYMMLADVDHSNTLSQAFVDSYAAVRPIPDTRDAAFVAFQLINLVDIVRWIVDLPPEFWQKGILDQLHHTVNCIASILQA
jgi:Ser/Thr protein kinase RdoA (MazF antagonist)